MIAQLAYAGTGPCWVCGSTLGDRFHAATLDFAAWTEQDPELAAYTGEQIWLQRCRACGFAQPDRIPALPRYFERMYDQRWSPEWVAEEFDSTYKDVIFTRILDELSRRVAGSPRALLDIGSHAGRFLHMATRAGWRAVGTEINARTAAYAAERSGAAVHRVRAECVSELGKRFDAVTLTDVLEHIPEPVRMLETVRKVLAPRGWVAVKVPCGPAQLIKETWRERLGRGYRATLADNLVHVNHFSPTSLRRALERANFDEIAIEVAAPECPPGSPASTAVRMALWHAARLVPLGIHTPSALHLLAFARRPDGS
ncbi:MAG TPA: class I SAM-dependent methyltransferase [Vicinamibacterales bacterium]|nr:class I SAM-dependent methyltransferase [Vicinamibacterales bacterium]